MRNTCLWLEVFRFMTGESVALDMKAYSHLSAEERVRIDELWNREGLGVRQIAPRIGRDKSTVSRELKRGLWSVSNENDSYRPCRPRRSKTDAWTSRPFHSAMAARRKAEQRARWPRRPTRMAYPPPLFRVMDALRRGWTPKRIEGRLKVERPADPRMRGSNGLETTARRPPATCSWTSHWTCPPISRTRTPRTNEGRTKTATGASAVTYPRGPASTTCRTRTCRPSSTRSTTPP